VCSSDASTHSPKKFTVKPILIENERSNYCCSSIEHTHTHTHISSQNKKQHDEEEAHTYTHTHTQKGGANQLHTIIRTYDAHKYIYTHTHTYNIRPHVRPPHTYPHTHIIKPSSVGVKKYTLHHNRKLRFSNRTRRGDDATLLHHTEITQFEWSRSSHFIERERERERDLSVVKGKSSCVFH
jgi:hypothetical protein